MIQSTIIGAILLTAAASVQAAPVVFSYTGGADSYIVPTSGTYDIVAYGGQGGGSGSQNGGLGAQIEGTFLLTAGDTLSLIVGGQGAAAASGFGAGGGGGSFVYDASSTAILVVAGGGGGAYVAAGNDARTATSGGLGVGTRASYGYGGTGGFGGGARTGGGGGGGFFGGGVSGSGGGGGSFSSPTGGAAGGAGGAGGFGGGGGGGNATGAGGGGGYSGGGGSSGVGGIPGGGGGGGSFDTGIAQVLLASVESGSGLIDITLVSAANPVTDVPEPAGLTIFAMGVGCLLLWRRLRSLGPVLSLTAFAAGMTRLHGRRVLLGNA